MTFRNVSAFEVYFTSSESGKSPACVWVIHWVSLWVGRWHGWMSSSMVSLFPIFFFFNLITSLHSSFDLIPRNHTVWLIRQSHRMASLSLELCVWQTASPLVGAWRWRGESLLFGCYLSRVAAWATALRGKHCITSPVPAGMWEACC